MKKTLGLILFPLLLTSCMTSEEVVNESAEIPVAPIEEIQDKAVEVDTETNVVENTDVKDIDILETEKIIQETEETLSGETVEIKNEANPVVDDELFNEVLNEINEIIQLSEEDESQ
ncbi:MAG: hypothetical protein GY828_06560 [Candidatus Gracilibacteria bacterium]|nr:hypothetical protein [Candidatus Gracilibacteria bacterium]